MRAWGDRTRRSSGGARRFRRPEPEAERRATHPLRPRTPPRTRRVPPRAHRRPRGVWRSGAPRSPARRADDLLALERPGASRTSSGTREKETLAAVDLLGRVVERADVARRAPASALALAASRRADLLVRAVEEYARGARGGPRPTRTRCSGPPLGQLRFQGHSRRASPTCVACFPVDPDEPLSLHVARRLRRPSASTRTTATAEGYLRRAARAPRRHRRDGGPRHRPAARRPRRGRRGEEARLARVRALTNAAEGLRHARADRAATAAATRISASRASTARRSAISTSPRQGPASASPATSGSRPSSRTRGPRSRAGDANGDGDDDLSRAGALTTQDTSVRHRRRAFHRRRHRRRRPRRRDAHATPPRCSPTSTTTAASTSASRATAANAYHGGDGGRFTPDPAGSRSGKDRRRLRSALRRRPRPRRRRGPPRSGRAFALPAQSARRPIRGRHRRAGPSPSDAPRAAYAVADPRRRRHPRRRRRRRRRSALDVAQRAPGPVRRGPGGRRRSGLASARPRLISDADGALDLVLAVLRRRGRRLPAAFSRGTFRSSATSRRDALRARAVSMTSTWMATAASTWSRSARRRPCSARSATGGFAIERHSRSRPATATLSIAARRRRRRRRGRGARGARGAAGVPAQRRARRRARVAAAAARRARPRRGSHVDERAGASGPTSR